MATDRASGGDCTTADDGAAARGLLANDRQLSGDVVMDWSQVMARTDLTLAEKRANYEADCRRRGIKADPKAYAK